MNIARHLTPYEVWNNCSPETDRESILFEKIKELLDEISDLEDKMIGEEND